MARKIKIRKIIDDSFWDDFVLHSIHGTIFSTSTWLKASAAVHGGKPRMLGVWDGEDMIAGVSFIEIRKGTLKKASNHILSPYCGFIYRGSSGELQLDTESIQLFCAGKLINYLQEKYNYVSFSHAPSFRDIRPFSWEKWDTEVRYTYLIPLDNIETQWNTLKSKTRQKINKAERLLTLGNSISDEEIGKITEMNFRERGETPSVPSKTLVGIIARLRKAGMVDVITALDENGKLATFQVVARDRNTVYLWVNGTVPDKKHLAGDSLMVWEVMKRYAGTHKTLDMVGANIPSVAYFKKSFCGMLTPYYVTGRYSSAAAKTAFKTFTKVKGMLSR